MLLGLFLMGTLWFWILMALAAIVVGAYVAYDKTGKATLCLVTTFVLLWLFGDFSVLRWLSGHGLEFLEYLGVYATVGAVWSLVKWWSFTRKSRKEFDHLKEQFLHEHGIQAFSIPDGLKREWLDWIAASYNYGSRRGHRFAYPPKAHDHKNKIVAWMAYWPWSLALTLVNDPLRRLYEGLFNAFRGLYQRISDSAFKDVKSDFEAPAPTSPPGGGNGRDLKPVPPDPTADDDHRTMPRS